MYNFSSTTTSLEAWLSKNQENFKDSYEFKEIMPAEHQKPLNMIGLIGRSIRLHSELMVRDSKIFTKMVTILTLMKFYPALGLDKIGAYLGKDFDFANKVWDFEQTYMGTESEHKFKELYFKVLSDIRTWIKQTYTKIPGKRYNHTPVYMINGNLTTTMPVSKLRVTSFTSQNIKGALPVIANALGLPVETYYIKTFNKDASELRCIFGLVVAKYMGAAASIVKLAELFEMNENGFRTTMQRAKQNENEAFLQKVSHADEAFLTWYKPVTASYKELALSIMSAVGIIPEEFSKIASVPVADARSVITMILKLVFPELSNSEIGDITKVRADSVSDGVLRGYALLEDHNRRFIETYNKAVKAANDWYENETIDCDNIKAKIKKSSLKQTKDNIVRIRTEMQKTVSVSVDTTEMGSKALDVLCNATNIDRTFITSKYIGDMSGKQEFSRTRSLLMIVLKDTIKGLGYTNLGKLFSTEKRRTKEIVQLAREFLTGINAEFAANYHYATSVVNKWLDPVNCDEDTGLIDFDSLRPRTIKAATSTIAKALDIEDRALFVNVSKQNPDIGRNKKLAVLVLRKYFPDYNYKQLGKVFMISPCTIKCYVKDAEELLYDSATFKQRYDKVCFSMRDWLEKLSIKTLLEREQANVSDILFTAAPVLDTAFATA